MLPKNLTSTYRQYKHDTDAIASWLATTAKRYGYISQAPTANGAKSQKTGKQGRINYTIAVKDFTTLAEFLAKKTDPIIQVPYKLAALLDRNISIRRWASEMISTTLPEGEGKQESDGGHAFFLGVLTRVRDVLSPRYTPAYVPTENSAASIEEVVNMFEHLDIEEPSEAFKKAPNVVLAPMESTNSYKVEQTFNLDEVFLAFHLLLADINNVRAEVSKAWERFKRGQIDLVTASITTNTAVDLARAMEEDLGDLFARHGGVENMLFAFYTSQCVLAGFPPFSKERPDDGMEFRTYDLADVLLWPAHSLLSAFSRKFEPGRRTEYRPGFYGTYKPSNDRPVSSTISGGIFKDDSEYLTNNEDIHSQIRQSEPF
ncbi:hypothetical protein BDV96DRAFT_638144 [Lophiotrema nucula]|uniref:DUF6604 domain-containing protein n=1 Tax=Lophiotrema nucula TaxID=690887 RepID=A0A6A5YJU0_9PLEO|nr:hypothetical protein BDV96DRAFT_638144 [Lophiotrema nucula]